MNKNKVKKGLRITVYRFKTDCTNGGISGKFENLTLIGDGVDEVFAPDETAPAVTIVTREIAGDIYKHLVPCDENAKPLPGWFMMGGNFGYCSDSRFPHKYPLPIHDRQE
jgi:hypothetical protein